MARLQESLPPEQASMKEPDPKTKRQIRCLCQKAKSVKRIDVIKKLREIAPAGTTGEVFGISTECSCSSLYDFFHYSQDLQNFLLT